MSFQQAKRERGLYQAQVKDSQRVGPHIVRVTVAGESLTNLPRRGFDHWFRLFLPLDGDVAALELIPDRFSTSAYLKFVATGAAQRLTVRNYTVRHHRPEAGEVDIDFAGHDGGIATAWAQRARPGDRLALLDQACGFDLRPDADSFCLAGDETAQPAILGILRDLPATARGLGVIELADLADAQDGPKPPGMELRQVVRQPDQAPGTAALAEVRGFQPEHPATGSAYLAGEQRLAVAGRRHLVAAGVPKPRVIFMGYWRAG
jgi:NADPH-dependent ferric siderophore reductase